MNLDLNQRHTFLPNPVDDIQERGMQIIFSPFQHSPPRASCCSNPSCESSWNSSSSHTTWLMTSSALGVFSSPLMCSREWANCCSNPPYVLIWDDMSSSHMTSVGCVTASSSEEAIRGIPDDISRCSECDASTSLRGIFSKHLICNHYSKLWMCWWVINISETGVTDLRSNQIDLFTPYQHWHGMCYRQLLINPCCFVVPKRHIIEHFAGNCLRHHHSNRNVTSRKKT